MFSGVDFEKSSSQSALTLMYSIGQTQVASMPPAMHPAAIARIGLLFFVSAISFVPLRAVKVGWTGLLACAILMPSSLGRLSLSGSSLLGTLVSL
jgi:hypothetical protein